jgi:S-methylmethionine-dependent homocysteine/selenocysteine methylase
VSRIADATGEGLAPHVDLWLAETQSSIVEARAIHAGLPKDGKPFWLSFTLKDEDVDEVPRLRSGEPVAEAAAVAAELGVETLLFNCSQPEVIGAAIDAAREAFERLGVNIQIGAYANAFPPQPKEATANDGLDPLRDDLDPPGYLQWAADWRKRGASHLGGAAGSGRSILRCWPRNWREAIRGRARSHRFGLATVM